MIALAILLSLAGAGLLCAAMKRHLSQLAPAMVFDPRRAVAMRAVAYVLLAFAAALCVRAEGTGVGLTLFFGLFCAAHFAVAMLLPVLQASRREN